MTPTVWMMKAQNHLMKRSSDCASTELPVHPTDFQHLRDTVDPLSPSNSYGIDLYEQTVDFICHL